MDMLLIKKPKDNRGRLTKRWIGEGATETQYCGQIGSLKKERKGACLLLLCRCFCNNERLWTYNHFIGFNNWLNNNIEIKDQCNKYQLRNFK